MISGPDKKPEKRRRPSRSAIVRWVLAVIACSGTLAYFPGVCSAVFLVLVVLLVPVGPLEKWLARHTGRLRRVRTATIAALFLLAACIAPRETEPAAPGHPREASVQQEPRNEIPAEDPVQARETPPADVPEQETPAPVSEVSGTPEPEASSPAEPESPSSPEPAPQAPAASEPAPAPPDVSPEQSETVYITQTGKKYHRAGCRHLQKSQIPISLDDAKTKGYTACKSCGG